MRFPKYVKTMNGQIGIYAHLTFGNRPVYRFEEGEYKLRQATEEELANGSDRLSELLGHSNVFMQWQKLSSSMWEAVGKYGKFRIDRRTEHYRIKYFVCYASEDGTQNFRPKDTLTEAKDFCERSPYWEDVA